MKKLLLITLCLIGFTTPVTAGTFTTFVSGTKNTIFVVGSIIKYFYFPRYSTVDEEVFSSNENSLNSLSSNEDPESAHYLKHWADKDLVDKGFRWNKNALRKWGTQVIEEGEIPLENSAEILVEGSTNILEEEGVSISPNDLEKSDSEDKEVMLCSNYRKNLFLPISEQLPITVPNPNSFCSIS